MKEMGEWALEHLKAASDFLVLFFLRLTSRHGGELTESGKEEQAKWGERRRRCLKDLEWVVRRKRREPDG